MTTLASNGQRSAVKVRVSFTELEETTELEVIDLIGNNRNSFPIDAIVRLTSDRPLEISSGPGAARSR